MSRPWVGGPLALFVSVVTASAQSAGPVTLTVPAHAVAQAAATPALTFDQALTAALASDARHSAASDAVRVAEARRREARSAWWPQLSGRISASRFDEAPNFQVPATTVTVPASTFVLPPMAVTLPAGAFGPGFPAADVTLPVPGAALPVPAQQYAVPAQDVRLMDATLVTGTLDVLYALYTGGLASARAAQAGAGIEAARQELRDTDAAVAYDVSRAYWGALLAHKLKAVASDTYERMRATLDLTERLYQTGSGRVKKTDYLRNRAMVDTIAAMVAEVDAQERSALAALATLVHWQPTTPIAIAATEFPEATDASVDALAQAAGESPRIARVTAGAAAARAGIDAALAGYKPTMGAFARLTRLGNSYDAGIVTPRNRTSWAIGLGVDVPLFDGFRTAAAVAGARAEARRLSALERAQRDGVSLEVRQAAIALDKARSQRTSTRRAYEAATENRDLHVRAYQDELVETKDMIEAQLVEAVLAGQHLKTLYDVADTDARLRALLGRTR